MRWPSAVARLFELQTVVNPFIRSVSSDWCSGSTRFRLAASNRTAADIKRSVGQLPGCTSDQTIYEVLAIRSANIIDAISEAGLDA
jgi:hypothetical protein